MNLVVGMKDVQTAFKLRLIVFAVWAFHLCKLICYPYFTTLTLKLSFYRLHWWQTPRQRYCIVLAAKLWNHQSNAHETFNLFWELRLSLWCSYLHIVFPQVWKVVLSVKKILKHSTRQPWCNCYWVLCSWNQSSLDNKQTADPCLVALGYNFRSATLKCIISVKWSISNLLSYKAVRFFLGHSLFIRYGHQVLWKLSLFSTGV